jgi:hypothetical protein
VTSGDQPRDPEPAGEAAGETPAAPDDLTAAIAGVREAMDRLRRTWDTGMAQTLRQLDQMRERTDELVARVTGNLDLLRRRTNHR